MCVEQAREHLGDMSEQQQWSAMRRAETSPEVLDQAAKAQMRADEVERAMEAGAPPGGHEGHGLV